MRILFKIFVLAIFIFLGAEKAHSTVNYNVIKDWYLKIPSPADLSVANSTCDHEVFSMAEFQGNLYLGMYAAQNNCQSSTIYKWDGQNLTKFKSFLSGNHFQQVILAVYSGKLYVGVGGDNLGDGDIYVWDPQTDVWTKSLEDTTHHRVHSMQVFNGKLYVGFGYTGGKGDVYEFNGSSWQMVFDGNLNQSLVEAMTVHNGKLIIGGGHGISGDYAFIYQYDGVSWTPVYDPTGTGNNSVLGLASYDGKLYASFQSVSIPAGDDVKFWDGSIWTTIFDDNNVTIAHGPVAYNGRLYIGTTPVSGGGQVFRYDGINATAGWTKVFQASNGEQEAFFPIVYGGEMLVGFGFDYLEANVYAYQEILGISPIANAGADMEESANQEVVLNGGLSSDVDGSIVNYQWMRLPDNQVVCTNTLPTCQTTTLGRAQEVIQLTVTDNHGNTAKDTMSIYHKRVPSSTCGNNVVEVGESCDGNTVSCLTPANYLGQKICNGTCSGFGNCVPSESCGDLTVNGPEVCDGGVQVCVTPSGYAGQQSCNAQCTGYDPCQSVLSCGNGITDGNEVCDGNSQACVTPTGYAGQQGCNAQCTGFDLCQSVLTCGDGITNGNEVCDGNSQPCVTGAGYAGTQVCSIPCDGFGQCLTTLSCGDGLCSSPETSVTCPADCPSFVVTLEAEAMTTKTIGKAADIGWNIYGNGYVESSVNFPAAGMYRFNIIAKSTSAAGVWANMDLRIDQVKKAGFTVNSAEYATYTVNVSVAAGSRKVAIAFTNDYYVPPEDRNLIVDKVVISK